MASNACAMVSLVVGSLDLADAVSGRPHRVVAAAQRGTDVEKKDRREIASRSSLIMSEFSEGVELSCVAERRLCCIVATDNGLATMSDDDTPVKHNAVAHLQDDRAAATNTIDTFVYRNMFVYLFEMVIL